MTDAAQSPPLAGAENPRDLRVYFAAQRTMLAWVRTGVSLMGFGFVVARFGLFLRELAEVRGVPSHTRGGASVWAGIALLAVGVAVNALAAVRFARFVKAYRRSEPFEPAGMGPELIVASVLAGIGVLLAMYLVRIR